MSTPPSTIGRIRFSEVDALRGIMAMYVMVNHIVGIGQGAAMLFAMLSAFLMTHVYASSIQSGRLGLGKFLALRTGRFYPSFLITTAAMLGVVALGAVAIPHPHNLSTAGVALYNLFMVDYSAIWGSGEANGWWTMINAPAWSLCVLFWMNILILWPVLRTRAWVVNGVICVAIGFMALILKRGQADLPILNEPRTMQMIFSFTLGIFVYHLYGKLKGWADYKIGKITTYILVFAGAAYFTPLSEQMNPIACILYFGLVMTMLAIYHGQLKLFIGKVWSFFAKISFSMFLVHWPVMHSVRMFTHEGFWWITLSIVISVLCAWILHKCVEMPIYNWTKAKLNSK